MCIFFFSKFPDDADTADPGATLGTSLAYLYIYLQSYTIAFSKMMMILLLFNKRMWSLSLLIQKE